MKNVSLLALASVMAPAVARAEEPRDLLVTVTTAHVLPSVRTAEALARKLTQAGVDFIIEPHVRFKGETGEQATMFFLDPSGNALEFKSFADMSQVFAK